MKGRNYRGQELLEAHAPTTCACAECMQQPARAERVRRELARLRYLLEHVPSDDTPPEVRRERNAARRRERWHERAAERRAVESEPREPFADPRVLDRAVRAAVAHGGGRR